MGYGQYESIDWEEDGEEKPLSEHEKMLAYHEISSEEFNDLSNNSQREFKWNYRKFGRVKSKSNPTQE